MSRVTGKVSVWVNIVPFSQIPKSYGEERYGDDGPLSDWCAAFGFDYYDHDFMDVNISEEHRRPIRRLAGECSFSASFIDPLESAAIEQGFDTAQQVILLYDFDYTNLNTGITEDKYYRFIGTFDYDDDADSVYDAYGPGGSMASE